MRRPAKTPPATPNVLPLMAAAALWLAVAAAPVDEALAAEPDAVALPLVEEEPAVVLVEVEMVLEDEVSVTVATAPVPVVLVEVEVVTDADVEVEVVVAVLPDLEISKVSDWARMPLLRGSTEFKLNLYLAPSLATKLVRVYLLSEVLTLSLMVTGTMVLWSTRTSWKVDGSVLTEFHLISMDLEKSSSWSLVGEVTMMAGRHC